MCKYQMTDLRMQNLITYSLWSFTHKLANHIEKANSVEHAADYLHQVAEWAEGLFHLSGSYNTAASYKEEAADECEG